MYFIMEPSPPESKIRPLLGISFSYSSSSSSSKLGRRALENRDLFCTWYSSPLTPRSAGVEDEDDDEYENEASYQNSIRQRG
jgi:hypothetical protein